MANTVIVIDSGISSKFRHIESLKIVSKKNFCTDCNEDNVVDLLGHGTAVTSVIHSINNQAEFILLKIYGDQLIQEEEVLIQALDYILEKGFTSCILHMSLGLNYYSNLLYNKCKEIYDRGNLIISAFDNSGSMSYPAAFDFVVGVEASDHCIKGSDFVLPSDDIIKVYSKGGVHRVAWIDGKYAIRQGNSISAAFVTGHLSCQNIKNFTMPEVINLLKKISTYKSYNSSNKKYIDFTGFPVFEHLNKMKNVAVFPYNKEISALVNFSDMLPFIIEGIYSNKYIGNINQTKSNFNKSTQFVIKNFDEIDYKQIDTLILGHLNILENYTRKRIKHDILQKCLANNVNVYSLDCYELEDFYDSFTQQGLFLYSPGVKKNKSINRGKLFKIKSPILLVLGTSSKQGKFTLQLLLRREFQKNGYNIAQLSTEPTGFLFGIEATIPFGFNSNNHLTDYEFIDYVNSAIHELDIKDPDIILAGSQSRTISESFNHLGHTAVKQLEFLLAVKPDGVLLCVNPGDEIEYINRTIAAVESLTSTKIIALVLFPFVYKNSWQWINGNLDKISADEIQATKLRLEQNYNIPCCSIDSEEDIIKVYDTIINYFSE